MKIMSAESERPIAFPEPTPAQQPRPPYRGGSQPSGRRALLFASPLLLGAIVVVLGAMIVVFMAWRSVNPGYVGVVFDKVNHRVTAGVLEPGWAIINPFTQSIQEYPVTIQTYSMLQKGSEGQVAGDDSLKVQSSEGQQLNLDVVIQYQVKKDEAGVLYQDWGGAPIEIVEDRVVRQYTRSQVPVIAAKYGWEEIAASKRGDIASQVANTLTAEFAKRHLILVSFGIREVHLPESLQQALDNKIQAQQQAEQQRYQLEQARVKADQDKVEAQGHAQALQAQAEGEAQATRIRAEAQSEANKLLAQSLTPELIRYQQLQRWDGRLPVFSGSGATPLIDVSSLVSPLVATTGPVTPTTTVP
jgi:regulator of protease activity HflC (stomatin/prohibitin superfamily)